MATTKKTESVTAEQAEAARIGKVKSALFGKAQTILKGNHEEEFETILAGLYKEAGLTRTRRLSKEEKERADFERLAKKFGYDLSEPVED